jgi:hypothetical protein
MSRLDAVRQLQRLIAALDDEGLLGQAARDRVLTAALGTLKRECIRARAERHSQQMTLTGRAA